MTEQNVKVVENEVKVTKGNLTRVTSTVSASNPEGKTTSAIFTRKDFEGALDKVSRPQQTPERA